jgi:hypothetical protein
MTNLDDLLPSATDCMQKIALAEAEKASQYMLHKTAAEAEKKALLDKLEKPSGISDDERMKRVSVIIQRAVSNGQTEVFLGKLPKELFTDHGRAINQAEPGWENTLTGLGKEAYDFWRKYLQPRGYKLRYQVVDYPEGIPGDIGITLSWL